MAKSSSNLGYVSMLLLLLIIGVVLYVAVVQKKTVNTTERFSTDKYALIPKDKIVVYQGSTLPDSKPKSVVMDNDESLPPVDGKQGSSKSMFMLAYNKCDPSCCPSTYSCSGGCVCMTKDQVNFVGNRGNNSTSCQVI